MRSAFSNTVTAVARARQLLGRGQSGGAAADHGDFLAGARLGNFGRDPSVIVGVVDDGAFDHLDGHRRLVDPQHASRLARGRADASGELGEIIGGVQHAHGFVPAAFVHQIVPVRNDVGERAAGVAEGHAAIHAARALLLDLFDREVLVNFKPVVDALRHRPPRGQLARVLHEAGNFTHAPPPPYAECRARA